MHDENSHTPGICNKDLFLISFISYNYKKKLFYYQIFSAQYILTWKMKYFR